MDFQIECEYNKSKLHKANVIYHKNPDLYRKKPAL